jgi:hypothetical protein
MPVGILRAGRLQLEQRVRGHNQMMPSVQVAGRREPQSGTERAPVMHRALKGRSARHSGRTRERWHGASLTQCD